MAGVDRITHNSVDIDGSIPNIADYRGKSKSRTANGLDRRFGAGQFNIYHSYFIIAGGEINSREDETDSKGIIVSGGFEYDPYFGGVDGSNSTASYYFTVTEVAHCRWASLAWNVNIDGGTGTSFDGKGILYNLDLHLYDVTEPSDPHLVESSNSPLENTENLWVQLPKKGIYMIQVRPGPRQKAFLWDYAIAWRIGKSPGVATDWMRDDKVN
jgi:hypothetical protein